MTSSGTQRGDRGLAPPFTPDGPVLVAILGALDDLHDLLAARLPQAQESVPVDEPAPDEQPDGAIPIQEPAPAAPPAEAVPVTEPAPKRKYTPRKTTGKGGR